MKMTFIAVHEMEKKNMEKLCKNYIALIYHVDNTMIKL